MCEDDWFLVAGQAPLALNAPEGQGLPRRWLIRNAKMGFNAEARVRFTTAIPGGVGRIRGHRVRAG